MSRRKKRHGTENVEMNLAAMLDMAFQLLAFFIFTFKPSPVEGQVDLNLPPATAVTVQQNSQKAGEDSKNENPVEGLNTLVVSLFPNAKGEIGDMALGEQSIASISGLKSRMTEILRDPNSPFDQVVIQVGSRLKYQELMNVIDICTQQKLASGERLTKISFVELPEAPK